MDLAVLLLNHEWEVKLYLLFASVLSLDFILAIEELLLSIANEHLVKRLELPLRLPVLVQIVLNWIAIFLPALIAHLTTECST